MPEETIPWWRKALKFALGGIRSGFGLFSRTASPEPSETPEISGRIEETSLEAEQHSLETGQLEAAQEEKLEAEAVEEPTHEEKAEEERALTESFPQAEVAASAPAPQTEPHPAVEAAIASAAELVSTVEAAAAPVPVTPAQDFSETAAAAPQTEAEQETQPIEPVEIEAVEAAAAAEPAPAQEAEAEPAEEVSAAGSTIAEAKAEPVETQAAAPEADCVAEAQSAEPEPIAEADSLSEPELEDDEAQTAEADAVAKPAEVTAPLGAASQVDPIPEADPAPEADPIAAAAAVATPEEAPASEPAAPVAEIAAEPIAEIAAQESAETAPETAPDSNPEPNPDPNPEPNPAPESIAAAAPAAGEAPLVLTPQPTAEEAAAKKAAEREAARLAARQKKLDEGAEQSPFSVFVGQVYDGPLDLLLDLIRKQDIDIYDIPIAKITSQFLAYVNQLKSSDVDVAGEFIYTASLLIHIKSRMLLPRTATGPDEAAEDPRRELVERLLEHERFKNAAQMLQEKQMLEAASWTNPGVREFKDDEATEPEIAADTVDLVRIFREILERAKKRPIFNVDEDSVTVGQMIQFLGRRLTMDDKPVALRRLLSHTRSERALIAMFLALLELVRLQAILLRQDRAFSEIFIKKSTGFDAVMNEGLMNARDDWK